MSDVAAVAAETFEARIVKLEADLAARLTIDEARNRMLDAADGARQALLRPSSIEGDLFGDLHDPDHRKADLAERRITQGVQVLALEDFNAALDQAFPEQVGGGQVGD